MSHEVTVVNTNEMEWLTGAEILAEMSPEFVANLGPRDEVTHAFDHYYIKPLLREAGTGRRFDMAQFTPGYRDVTACYHESAEEGFILEGTLDLAYEGHFAPLSYFWRPPGWVHGAQGTEGGATALFSFEAARPEDGSGPVTRTVAPFDDAGKNVLLDETSTWRIGPRGYVPNVSGEFVARTPGVNLLGVSVHERLDAGNLSVRVLSQNVLNGGGSFLWDVAPGYSQPGSSSFTTTYHFFVVDGSIAIGDVTHPAGTWVYVPAGSTLEAISSPSGAVLYMKADQKFALA